MSEAENLLNSLGDISIATVDPSTEEHIVIDNNRRVYVPDSLKRIAVQYDHNIETVTFDCPRYWDGLDMSTMKVYINYVRSDGQTGKFNADPVTIDEDNDNIMHFDWVISRNVTEAKGILQFLVCVNTVNDYGEAIRHWNSELNREMFISEGLEVDDSVLDPYPDIVTQLLLKMDTIEADNAATRDYIDAGLQAEVGSVIQDMVRDGTIAGVDLSDYATKAECDELNGKLYTLHQQNEAVESRINTVERSHYDDLQLVNSNITAVEEAMSADLTSLSLDTNAAIGETNTQVNTNKENIASLTESVEAIADYPIESGTKEVNGITWIYEKWNSGVIKLWCSVTCAYKGSTYLEGNAPLPFESLTDLIGFTTITITNYGTGNSGNNKNAKVYFSDVGAAIFVHDKGTTFSSGNTEKVSLHAIGKWK